MFATSQAFVVAMSVTSISSPTSSRQCSQFEQCFAIPFLGVSAIGARLQHDWRPYAQVMLPAPRQWQAPLEMFFLWGAKENNQQRLGLLRVSVFDLYKLLSCCGPLFVLALSLALVSAGFTLFHTNGTCNFSN